MRGCLLATTAVLGSSMAMAGGAAAQMPGPPNVMVMAGDQSMPKVKPGQMVVRLKGMLAWYTGLDSESQVGSATTSGTTKISSYGFFGYIRLYPRFDAKLTNGLRYGVKAEIRDGIGAGNTTATYWRRAAAYLRMHRAGTVWVGQIDGPASTFLVGTGENWDTGGWHGDAPGIVSQSAYAIDWTAPETGREVTTNKFQYYSPSFAGFDFGLSFAPSGVKYETFNGSVPIDTRYASIPGGAKQVRNIVEIMGRYRGTFGPVGLTVEGGYISSGVVNNNTGPTKYHGLSQGDAGVQLSFVGFTLGGHTDFGRFNYVYVPARRGSKTAFNYELGISYEIGPVVVGGQLTHDNMPGNYNGTTITKNLSETGLAFGGTYTLTSGVSMYATYLYGEKKQSGYDWSAVGGASHSDKIHVNAFVVGTGIHW